MIGYRGNLLAHIDKFKRAHVPELGGYAEINPPWIIGQDCIVFSGGRLAESLRAASPWLGSPHVPGHGQGRLLVMFSPFMAGKQALAVVANDSAGFEKASAAVVDAARKTPPPKSTPSQTVRLVAAKVAQKSQPVDEPYRNYSPELRSLKLLAADNGRSVLVLAGQNDNLAFIDEHGRITSTVQAPT